MKTFYFSLFASFLLLSSCIKNNEELSWLQVNKWTLTANTNLNSLEGQLTENITEAWVYIDDKIIGVFEVPFKIPILKEGNVQIKIYPAIKNNGISGTKKIYPFLKPFVVSGTLVKNETLTVNPTTMYFDNTTFFIEDFEDGNVELEDDVNSSAHLYVDNDPLIIKPFNGVAFGRVDMNNVSDSLWLSSTVFDYAEGSNLPRGKDVYLELDYYNTNNVVTGLLAVDPQNTVKNWNIQLNAQEPETVKWKKIYIDLRELITNSNQSALFQQIFTAMIDEGKSESLIVIDNIKLIHN